MNYTTYQHIEKLGTSSTEGILSGDVYLFYKIDGTNATIFLKDNGDLGFGSRRRELSMETKDSDNQDFVKEMMTNPNNALTIKEIKNYLTTFPKHILYGEWLVSSTLKTYKDDAWKQFYLFDIYDSITDSYIPYDSYSKYLDLNCPHVKYIPLLAKLTNPTFDDIKNQLSKTGDYLIKEGLGEGIVIKNYNYRNSHGTMKWAKMLTEDFRDKKSHVKEFNKECKENCIIEYNIIKLLTLEHINKEKNKLLEKYNGEWSDKHIFELLNRVFIEFFRDNWEIILKKFKNPTINFKLLKHLSDEKVKETLK